MSFSKASVSITLIICSLLAFISASTVVEHCVSATTERDVKIAQINKEETIKVAQIRQEQAIKVAKINKERTLKLQKMEYLFDLSERFEDKKIFEEISR